MIKKIAKFGIVGIIATALDFVIFALLKFIGINAVAATSISFTISLIINYILSVKFVFVDKKQMSKSIEVIGFAITAFIGLGINALIMFIGTEILNLRGTIIEMGIKVFSTGVVMIWNFLARQYFLEKDIKWIKNIDDKYKEIKKYIKNKKN